MGFDKDRELANLFKAILLYMNENNLTELTRDFIEQFLKSFREHEAELNNK